MKHSQIGADIIILASLTAVGLVTFLAFQWKKLAGLVAASGAILIAGLFFLGPILWLLDKSLKWSAPRQTPAQRWTWNLTVAITIIGALGAMFAGMLFFGGGI